MGKIGPKEIKKVVICYEDGEEKEMKKGFFCETQPGEECLNLTFHMFQVEGKELVCIIEGMMEFRVESWVCSQQQKKHRKEKRKTVEEKEVRCTPEELKELIENLEEGQILEVTFDAE